MRRHLLAVACLSITPFLAACGGSENQFIGEWHGVKSPNTLKIEPNGAAFMVHANDGGQTTNYLATLEGKTLKIDNGFDGITIVIDQSTGHLNGGGIEFERNEISKVGVHDTMQPSKPKIGVHETISRWAVSFANAFS